MSVIYALLAFIAILLIDAPLQLRILAISRIIRNLAHAPWAIIARMALAELSSFHALWVHLTISRDFEQ